MMQTFSSLLPPFHTRVSLFHPPPSRLLNSLNPVVYRDNRGVVTVSNPTEFPEVTDASSKVKEVREPVVKASIIIPEGKLSYKVLYIQSHSRQSILAK
jgi:translation elongation factor EF-4